MDFDAGRLAAPDRRVRVLGLELALDEPESLLRARAAHALGLAPEAIGGVRIARKALDARHRGAPRFSVHVDVTLGVSGRGRSLDRALASGRARELPPPARLETEAAHPAWRGRAVVVVGAGPAGLFAAHVLALHDVRVDLIDRGPGLRERGRAVARFLRARELDPERNLLFGEGGAGTYSDGKLYTRSHHALEEPILRALIACGAPEAIAYDARAHIGTDRLHRVLPRLRERLTALGVAFHFDTRLEALDASGGRVRAVRTSRGELPADAVVLAPGHSARDTLRALASQGVRVAAKPFQLGVRVEHPQPLIDRGRYGADPALAARLGPSYYALSCRSAGGVAGVHSFCMCPGGQIVAAVSSPGLLCTNGMSNSRHSSPYANAGLVVTVDPERLGRDPFAGWALQEDLEARFFAAGGGDWRAPAQLAGDFCAGRESASLRPTSYKFGVASARIDALLPDWITEALRRAIARFEREIPGFASEGQLVGIESRSSGAIRLPRDPELRNALGFANLFPVGEGAGHAGGIMSAAIDGARSAQALLSTSPAAAPPRSPLKPTSG